MIVISGPGGVGKGTLVDRLVAADDRLWLSQSWTTRARRPGEPVDAYHFVSRDAFERRAAEGGFLEWAPFLDDLYGTPTPHPPPRADALLEIDVQGARQVLARYPGALMVFVDAPSRVEQRARLEGRGEPSERIARRLGLVDTERAAAEILGARVVVNDDLDRSVAEVAAIIKTARAARSAASGAGTIAWGPETSDR